MINVLTFSLHGFVKHNPFYPTISNRILQICVLTTHIKITPRIHNTAHDNASKTSLFVVSFHLSFFLVTSIRDIPMQADFIIPFKVWNESRASRILVYFSQLSFMFYLLMCVAFKRTHLLLTHFHEILRDIRS